MKLIFILNLLFVVFFTKAQNIETIHFNPLTDSVKRGFDYYINIDAKLTNGKWLPLTNKELLITSTAGVVNGNNVLIPLNYSLKNFEVTIILKTDAAKKLIFTLPIKQLADPDLLPLINNTAAPKVGKNKKKHKK